MPSSHRRYAGWTIERIREDARKIGPATAALCEQILEARPKQVHLSALAAAADLSKRNITTATGARWCAMQVISDPRSQAPRPDPLSRGAG